MPMFPTDMDAARAKAEKAKKARADKAEKERLAAEHDAALVRAFANELRAKQGLPPLGPNEPVNVIICRRGLR